MSCSDDLLWLHTRSLGIHTYLVGFRSLRFFRQSSRLWPFPDIPAPSPQRLDHFRRHGRRQRNPDEDEGLVDRVRERELRPYTCVNVSFVNQ